MMDNVEFAVISFDADLIILMEAIYNLTLYFSGIYGYRRSND
jgi:hypothetical protein